MQQCRVCEQQHYAKGLCKQHYMRWRARGTLRPGKMGRPPQPREEALPVLAPKPDPAVWALERIALIERFRSQGMQWDAIAERLGYKNLHACNASYRCLLKKYGNS